MKNKIFLFLFLFFILVPIYGVNVSIDYKLASDVLEKGDNLSFKYINLSSDSDFNGSIKIFFDNTLKYEKEVKLNNSNNHKISIKNLNLTADDIYKKLKIKIYDTNNNEINKTERNLYIYYLKSNECKVLGDKILKEGENLNLKVKFKYEDKLDKKLYIYLDNEEKRDYSFDDEINKNLHITLDDLFSKVQCKVYLKEDDKNLLIYNKNIPILVYDLDDVKVKFDDKDAIKIELNDFELSNGNNKLKIKLSISDFDYEKEFKNVTSLEDVEFNIFDSSGIKDDEDKIELIRDIIKGITDKKGLEADLTVNVELNDSNINDDRDIVDDTFHIYKFKKNGKFVFKDDNDFKIYLLYSDKSVEQGKSFNVKTKVKLKEGDDVDITVCVAYNGKENCKQVTLDDNDDEDEAILNFKIDTSDLDPRNYTAFLYAYDEDYNKIIWESFNFEVKPLKAIKLEVLDPIIVGYKGDKKEIRVKIKNLYSKKLTANLLLKCGDYIKTTSVSILPNQEIVVKIPIVINEECNGIIKSDVTLKDSLNTFSILVKEIKNNEKKEHLNEKKGQKTELICNAKDLVYGKNNNLTLEITSTPGAKISVKYNPELLAVIPSEFESKGKDKITIIRKTDDKILTDLEITCEYDGQKRTIKSTVMFYENKKSFFEELDKQKLMYISLGLTGLILIAFILLLLV